MPFFCPPSFGQIVRGPAHAFRSANLKLFSFLATSGVRPFELRPPLFFEVGLGRGVFSWFSFCAFEPPTRHPIELVRSRAGSQGFPKLHTPFPRGRARSSFKILRGGPVFLGGFFFFVGHFRPAPPVVPLSFFAFSACHRNFLAPGNWISVC